MNADHPGHPRPPDQPGDDVSKRSGARGVPLSMWAVLALAVAGIIIYLVVDHWPHVLAALPYVGIVAFAAMHLFGHRGHGGHGGHGGHNKPPGEGSDPT